MYFVYILYSVKLKKFYKGQTSNIDLRLKRHNGGHEKYTSAGIPWILLWQTTKENRKESIILESKLKNLSSKRLIQFILKYKEEIKVENLEDVIK